MFSTGNAVLFRADARSFEGDYREFFLRYLENDENGILMQGDMPRLWNVHGGQAVGPKIFDEDYPYGVRKVDYAKNLVWLEELN